MNLNLCNFFNEFNRGRSTLKDEFREGPPKTAVVPENIDTVCELIMQDRHVIYIGPLCYPLSIRVPI